MAELEGRVALVTGASRGIGAAIARRLAAEGARVVVSARNEAALRAIAADVDGVPVPMDVADPASTGAALDRIAAEVGRVDILVPNAGISSSAPYARTTDDAWERMMTVNATAVMRQCRRLIPAMVDAGWGRVVIVASNAGLMGYAYTSAYCASKHAVLGYMRAVALEIATSPVTINAICPGWVDTPMLAQAVDNIVAATGKSREDARSALARMSPQRRFVAPEEVAAWVFASCRADARSLHGQAIALDGGQVMR
ncbi:MAG: SDR family NAD(P)-dependent oxidoreductase [Myxococcota bacterium]